MKILVCNLYKAVNYVLEKFEAANYFTVCLKRSVKVKTLT